MSNKLPDVVDLISDSVQLIRKHFKQLGLVLLPMFVLPILAVIYLAVDPSSAMSLNPGYYFLYQISLYLVGFWSLTVTIRGIYQSLTKGRIDSNFFRMPFLDYVKTLFYLFILGILSSFVAGIVIVPFSMAFGAAIFGGSQGLLVFAFIIGLVFLIPAVILYLMFYAAPMAVIIEKMNPIQALSYSIEITKNKKAKLFILLFLFSLITGAVFAPLVGGGIVLSQMFRSMSIEIAISFYLIALSYLIILYSYSAQVQIYLGLKK